MPFSVKAASLVSMFLFFAPSADAKAFLRSATHLHEERVSEEDVQTSLLAEIEGTFGDGSASSRLKQLEESLRPIFAALPKNEQGYLGHATVRYALHRIFVQRHGWFIKGLHSAGGHRNATSSAGLLKEQVPAYIQDLFEKRLGGRGFGLHELGVLAATIEHLVHSEAVKRLGQAFNVHSFLPTSVMTESEADDILDTYMTSYILGEDLSSMNFTQAQALKAEMPSIYMSWKETQQFVRDTRKNVTESDGSAHQQASGEYDFSLVARTADRVGERFGKFQNQECRQIKADLLRMEEPGTGRVRLADFYKPALEGQWQFQESVSYLRQLGALDESDPSAPRVVIANYISSPSNCIASSNFYSVCCIDECEDLLGHLENEIAAPEASTTRIAQLVSKLKFSSVSAPRELSDHLLARLGEIAAQNGGSVPLHGRLFAQWMHHAFPSECPFPHISGTTNPQTPDEWLESTGEQTTASQEEMESHVTKMDKQESTEDDSEDQKEERAAVLPWSPEEELLMERSIKTEQVGIVWGMLRNIMRIAALGALGSVAYGAASNAKAASAFVGGKKDEKYLV